MADLEQLQQASHEQEEPAQPAQRQQRCRATQLTPRFDLLIHGEPVFLDFEFQEYLLTGATKRAHRIGRASVLNSDGETVLDAYAHYRYEQGVKKILPPKWLNFHVEWRDIRPENGAVGAAKLEGWLKQLFNGRPVVVHGGTHDLTAFYIHKDAFDKSTVVDTQRMYSHLQRDGHPSLAKCASEVLGETIQVGGHHPLEDANATRQLYLLQRPYNRAEKLAEKQAQRPERNRRSRRDRRIRNKAPKSKQ